jgi:hypothetical protein
MPASFDSSSTPLWALLEALNADILREIRMADAFIRQAACLPKNQYPVVNRRISLCAATALANATSLAAEVFALGGLPARPESLARNTSFPWGLAQARRMVLHYRNRLRMAERLGLLRLRAVFQEVVHTKERHVVHSGVIQAEGPTGWLYG